MDIWSQKTDNHLMKTEVLKSFLKARGMNPAELARKIGVSRQTVSLWFRSVDPGMNLKNATRLTEVLGVSLKDLDEPLFEKREQLETELLWDHLYPDLESFLAGVVRGQPAALARLVQVYGIFDAEKIAGKQIFKKFHQYKTNLPPAFRKKTEILWKLKFNPASI